MKGICALGIESDFLRILFACQQNNRLIPFSEAGIPLSGGDFAEILGSRIDLIEKEIRQREKQHSFSVEGIYCNLPPELARETVTEDVLPLTSGKKRRLTSKDIIDARAHVENVFLDWHHKCLHNIVLEYYVDDVLRDNLYPVPEGRKLKLKAQLVYIERRFHKECEDIFENIGRKFAGFVYSPLSDISINFPLSPGTVPPVVLNIGREQTICSGIRGGRVQWNSFEFGEKTLEEILARRFLFSSEVCREVFSRHLSFAASAGHKEVVIKEGNQYVNVSVDSLNSVIKESMAGSLEKLLAESAGIFGSGAVVTFLGRLSLVRGFFSFLNNRFPALVVEQAGFKSPAASLLGCIKYGTCRYFETIPLVKKSLAGRLLDLYREYF